MQSQTTLWAGPLPPPEQIERYNALVANGAERIFIEFEKEAAHRRKQEDRALTIEGWERLGGRIFAFIFCLCALVVTSYAVYEGAGWVGGVLGFVSKGTCRR